MSCIFAISPQLIGLISKMPQSMAFYFLKTDHVTPLDHPTYANEVTLSIHTATSMNVISPHRKILYFGFGANQTSVTLSSLRGRKWPVFAP